MLRDARLLAQLVVVFQRLCARKVALALGSIIASVLAGRLVAQDELRIGVESRSSYHDGFDVGWAHFDCVYSMIAERTHGIDYLRWDDQERARAKCRISLPAQVTLACTHARDCVAPLPPARRSLTALAFAV